ncbi:hypothetical protein JOM56_001940 [Amanita muscaria]
MAPRSDTPSTASADHSSQDCIPDTHSHLHRTTVIPRFPSFPKRNASTDSPREVPLPSPSLRQETISPFALAWDSMETPSPFFSSSRLNETVSNSTQGSTSRPSTPSMAAAVPLPKSPPLWADSLTSPSTLDSSKIPFHMGPRAGAHGKGKASSITDEAEASTETSLSAQSEVEQRLPSSGSSSSSGSTSPLRSDMEPPALEASSSYSSGSSASIESIASDPHIASRNTAAKSFEDFMNSNVSDIHGNSYSSTFSSYASNGLGIAYARPARPPSPSPPYLSRHMSISSRFSRPSSSHSPSTPYYLQPPEPPVILPPEADEELQQEYHRRAPHLPFLRRGPPPADSYIEVETTMREYRLLVKLPGFTRDGITLASKKRRILHVVADRWEGVGGHFERRISFGYDADLVQVRAEFDGEMLRVVVPRRPISSGFVAGNA